tara:strand:+ start:497 stop:778 length:282 start_codon:yes stop_codon:yes gene_type:complete
MTKEEFELEIKKKYDNLDKHQFRELLQNTHTELMKHTDENLNMIFKSSFEELVYEIFNSTLQSKRLTFKQFKALSAYSKTNWIEKEEEEYKQF